MPMTLDPDRTVTDFRGRLDDSVERYEALYEAVSDRAPANNLKLRRGLTTDLAFRIGTDWELFQHRWHIAAISKSPKTFVAFQQSRLDDLMRKNSTARHLLETANPGSTRIPARLSAERIDSMLDPDGYNITFKDPESWNARAQEHLSSLFAARVSAIVNDPEARCILELLKALRNHVAHGSTSSLAALNGVIVMRTERDQPGLVGARNEPLARARSTQVSSVATYLHGWAADSGLRRIGYLAARLRTIVDDLRTKPIDSANAA